jgi:hypothetical protein
VTKSLTVFLVAMLLTGGPVLAYLVLVSSDETHMRQMLRLTAWTAVLIYVVVFIARPLRQLVSAPFSRDLLRNRRYFGVALAAVMSVHLVLLLIVNEQALNVPGAAVFTFMYLMLLTSFDSAPAIIGPRNWRILHKIGLYGLGFAYAQSIGRAFLRMPLDPVYLTLSLLMLAAVTIRLAAFVKNRQRASLSR